MNPTAAGRTYPDVAFTVDPERVAAFRAVFGGSEGVPITFVTAAEFAVMPQIMADPAIDLDLSRVVHGDQQYEFVRPLIEGETLQVRSRIESIRVRGGNAFLEIATDLVGSDGEVAVTARSTMIERSESNEPSS